MEEGAVPGGGEYEGYGGALRRKIEELSSMDKIYVRGSIVSESGRHYAAEFAAGGSIPDGYCGDVIGGDLVLTANNSIKPYFEYIATGDIIAAGVGDGDIYVVAPPDDVINQFERDLDDILMMAEETLEDKKKQNLLYKMCYLNAVSAYEYFMGSYLMSVVLRNKDFFEKYCSRLSKSDTFSVVKHIECSPYTTEKNLSASYSRMFGVELPEFTSVRECIEIRNELSHRNGHCSYSKNSAPETFMKNDVEFVVSTVRSFVFELMERIRSGEGSEK